MALSGVQIRLRRADFDASRLIRHYHCRIIQEACLHVIRVETDGKYEEYSHNVNNSHKTC